MAIIAKNTGGADFERKLVSSGLHMGRCIRVIDLGLQKIVWKGQEKEQHKIMLVFEICDETITIDNVESPMVLSNEYTLSLSEKSALRPDLEGWRGTNFSEEELTGFDVSKLLDVPCTLNVTHGKSKDGKKEYANISMIAPAMKDKQYPPAYHDVFIYEITNGADEKFDKLPEWIQKKILAGRIPDVEMPQPPSEAVITEVLASKPPF